MANKEGVMLTRKGLQLVAKLSANAGDLQILAVKVGTGILPEGTDILPMTDIISYKMDGIIADCWYNPNGEDGYVVMQLDNTEVESGFVMTEIGLYATDPDLGEILYAYVDMSDDPNYIMPATYGSAGESDNMPMGPIRHKMVQMKLHILVGGAKSLSAVINPAAQITREVFDREINSIVTPEWDDSGEVEGIESFTDFMEKFVKGTSIYQMFANLKAGLKFILHAGHLVNNGMCETPGEFALDAAYGKTLQDQITQVYSDIQGIFIIVSQKKHVTVPVMSSQGYVQVTFLDIPPEGYRLICAIGFFISSGYPHLYGSYPDKDDPNRWSFSIYNNTTITGDAGVTGYFLCVKNMQ